MKRYCQTLELKNDPELIEAYVREHSRVWPEVQAGIREVGILDMQIYALGNRLFMIMDPSLPSTGKWRLMDKIFELDK